VVAIHHKDLINNIETHGTVSYNNLWSFQTFIQHIRKCLGIHYDCEVNIVVDGVSIDNLQAMHKGGMFGTLVFCLFILFVSNQYCVTKEERDVISLESISCFHQEGIMHNNDASSYV
jgi:hypothetical protein